MTRSEGYIRPGASPFIQDIYERSLSRRPGQQTPPKRKDQGFSMEEPGGEGTTQTAIAGGGEKKMGVAATENVRTDTPTETTNALENCGPNSGTPPSGENLKTTTFLRKGIILNLPNEDFAVSNFRGHLYW